MSTPTDSSIPENSSEIKTDNNYKLVINTHFFSTSLISLLTLLRDAFSNITNSKSGSFVNNCNTLITGFDLKNTSFDKSQIIKKIFKKLVFFLPRILREKKGIDDDGKEKNISDPDETIFFDKDDGKIITLIPGINIGLIFTKLSQEDKQRTWCYIYIMYISSFRMIRQVNGEKLLKNKKYDMLLGACSTLHMRVNESKIITTERELFNPCIGTQIHENEGKKLDVNTLFSGIEDISEDDLEEYFISNMISKLINPDDLQKMVHELKEDDITDYVSTVANFIGADKDSAAYKTCDSLVHEIVGELKSEGIDKKNPFKIAKRISHTTKVSESNLRETVNQFEKSMTKERLSTMKDGEGNNIGNALASSLETAKRTGRVNLSSLLELTKNGLKDDKKKPKK